MLPDSGAGGELLTANSARSRYLTRVCWNSAGWVHPTGEASIAERDSRKPHDKQPYTVRNGFGHEEWLFNLQWTIDGLKFAYLQPVGKSRTRLAGSDLDVTLYTISPPPERTRYYVGRIPTCHVLTEDEAEAAYRTYRSRGWLAEMASQAAAIGGVSESVKTSDPVEVFNVRFDPDAIQQNSPLEAAPARDFVWKLRRYTILAIGDRRVSAQYPGGRRGKASGPKRTGTLALPPRAATVASLVHNQLQNRLSDLLRAKLREATVAVERDFVDITVDQGGRRTLIEVKSESDSRYAIRESVGQLLDYAQRSEAAGNPVHDLVVAAPGKLDGPAEELLAFLRDGQGLPIRYFCFRQETTELDF